MFPYSLYPFDLSMSDMLAAYFLPKRRPRREFPKHWRYSRSISGLDLLANPRVTISDIVPVIPALGTIDPRLLARVQIDGA